MSQLKQRVEEWREIIGYPIYQVSSFGRVRSRGRHKKGWAILKPGLGGIGYQRIGLYNKKSHKISQVHHLVLNAFVGLRKPGQECRHLDGNPANNKLVNLRWGTKDENAADRLAHGRTHAGENHPMSKLTNAQVLEIKATYKRFSYHSSNARELAEKYGVATSTITNSINGKRLTSFSASLQPKDSK